MARNWPTFLSLNRFEYKKNVSLAISAFAQFRQSLTAADKNSRKLDTARIVIGGGYDPRVKDNIDTLDQLAHRVVGPILFAYELRRSRRRASRPPKPTSFSSRTLPPPSERPFSNHHTPLLSSIHSITSILALGRWRSGVRLPIIACIPEDRRNRSSTNQRNNGPAGFVLRRSLSGATR